MLRGLIDSYTPFNAEENAIAQQLRQFLDMSDNAYDRNNLVAHVVADAWIVNPARSHVLLIEHALNHFWMAPGGHCDGDPDVHAGALREVAEETGVTALTPLLGGGLFDLHSGHVSLRHKDWGIEPTHVHFDVCFAFEADDQVPLTVSHESTGLKWMALDTLSQQNFFPGHQRRVDKTLAGWLDAAKAQRA